jgi:hypothetical protein
MPDYRFYIVGHDGHFQSSEAFPDIASDDAALTVALQLIDGHDVEIWNLDRKVAVLDHTTKTLKANHD